MRDKLLPPTNWAGNDPVRYYLYDIALSLREFEAARNEPLDLTPGEINTNPFLAPDEEILTLDCTPMDLSEDPRVQSAMGDLSFGAAGAEIQRLRSRIVEIQENLIIGKKPMCDNPFGEMYCDNCKWLISLHPKKGY